MIGEKLSQRYQITAELGRGGMGVVYRAHDPVLNRDVAVKLIPPTQLSEEAEQRFQREAQLVAQMDHPAIVSIYDFGRHQGSLFFVMPVVEGKNLRAFLRGGTLPLGDILDIGIQVAEALEYSHSRGVVHRDIKPENIMVARDESGGVRIRVMDFGLARASTETRLTKTGVLVGTVSYLSPEQVSSTRADVRSDVYSLGTVLYECILGEPPFSGEMQSVLYRIVHEIPQPLRALGADIDEALESLLLSCLAKNPIERPQTASAIGEALRKYQSSLRESDLAKSVTGLTRSFQAQRPILSPFVGRQRESAELQQRLNAAISGECQFVLVGGEPGIGKTRLLDELENLARARKIRVLHGRSVEQDRSFPYQGFCELLQEFFRLRDSSSAPSPDLSDLASDLMSLFPMLSEIGDIRSAATGNSTLAAASSSGPENRTQIFELLARTLTRIAGGNPLVLILEDLHEAEVSIEALQYIVRRLGPTPTMLVGTYRSTEIDRRHPLTRMLESFHGDRRFSSVVLSPFSPAEHRQFLETLVGGSRLSESLVERLYEGTEGNPFFTKELIRSLMDSGDITRDDTGTWSLSAEFGLATDALPATIQQAVEKRIERLPDDLRELLSIAAVIGKTFDYRDLEKLADTRDVEDSVDRLVQEGYLEEERESRGDILSFSSGVVRDVLYAGISRRKRRTLHRKCAELIEARHAGRLERVLPELVHHFYQGDVPEKTVDYGLRLAQASLDAFSAEEAARSAKAALEFLDEEWEGERVIEGEARLLLARALRMAGDIEGALKEAEAAVRIFESGKRPARAAETLLTAAEIAWQARRSEDASRWVEKGLAVARSAEERDVLRQLLALAATLANLRSEYAKANAFLDEAARLGAGSKEARAEEEIPRGGRLVVALANPVKLIDPAGIETDEESEIATNVFETLLSTDSQGNLIPSLCERWEALEDGRAFLLTLRRDVRFSDGTPLTAHDVKRSIEMSIRRASPEVPAAYAAIRGAAEYRDERASEVEGVVAQAEDTIEIRLIEPLPIYPALLTEGSTGVVREVSSGADAVGLLGTGAFRITSQDRQRVVLERNPAYWKNELPRVDTIEFRTALSARTIAKEFRSGGIDLARDLLPDDLEELLRDARFRQGIVESAKKNTYFVLFNVRSGRFTESNKACRVLSGIVRTRDLVWRALGRFAEPAACWIPPGMLGHDPGRRRASLTSDEARQMLRASGLETPVRLKASVHPLFQDRYASLLSSLFSVWSELGVDVAIETSTMAAYLESWKESEGLDLLIGRWNADYDDPDNFTHTLFHSRGGALRAWFGSVESDAILEEARSESKPAVRESLYRKFDNLLLESGVLVPLFHDIDYRLASPRVRGLALRGTPPYVNYRELGLSEAVQPTAEPAWVPTGTIQVPIAGTVNTLDPAVVTTLEQAELLPSLFETLTRDAGGARIVPWLAAEFRIEEGGRRYRFRLRDDVRFHDGRRLTARDVRYSYERMLQHPEADSRALYSSIRGAKALMNGEAGDLTGFRIHSASEFSIDLEEPIAFFPALISYSAAAILPEGSMPLGGSGPIGWVGTGPFRMVTFEPGRRLELERNKTYWREGCPRNEGLVYTFGVEPKEMLDGFRSGRFSLASDLFPADVEVLRRDPEFASGYRETPRLLTYFIAFNTREGLLVDRELRRRLVEGLDVPRLTRQTVGRLAMPATSLIPPGLLGHDPGLTSRTDSGPASRREGLRAPIELRAAIHPLFFSGYSALLREIRNLWASKSVKIRPVSETLDEYVAAWNASKADLVLGRWGADYPDPDTFAYQLHSREGLLGNLCGTPETDRLVERGRAETSPAVRHAIYREVEEFLAREAILLPLFHEQTYRFARPELDGLSLSLGTQTVAYENLSIRT